jgi:dTDP-4-amino-4,6-dideoxygalactose transaminase
MNLLGDFIPATWTTRRVALTIYHRLERNVILTTFDHYGRWGRLFQVQRRLSADAKSDRYDRQKATGRNRMTQKVPLLDLQQQYAQVGRELEAAVLEVLRSGHYILGKFGQKLEEQIGELSGCQYGIGVANGTDALVLALWALDIGPGDEVITTPFTFAATVEAITLRGAKPVFVDVFQNSYNIDVREIEKAITKTTKAILPIHLYGQSADMDPIVEIAKKHGLHIIEDNAQALGATYKGRPTGSFGDLACTSFYPTKNLGAAGDAGMVTTNSEKLYKRVKSLRAHGMTRRYYHDELGVNSRLDEMQAAVLVTKLPYLKEWTAKRQAVAEMYNKALAGIPGIATPQLSIGNDIVTPAEIHHVWHQYTVRVLAAPANGQYGVQARDSVVDELAKHGVGAMCYYPVPLHEQDAFRNLGYKRGDFPMSETLSDQVLSLPMYPELKAEQIEYVASALREIMTARSEVGANVTFTQPALSIQ